MSGQLTPPLGRFAKRFPAFLFCPLKNCTIRNYLNIELVILQECIGHLSPTRGPFQSHIPGGYRLVKLSGKI